MSLNFRAGWRFGLALLLVVVFGDFGKSDVTVVEEETSEGHVVWVHRLSVTPAPELKPAFKYRFSVEPHRTIPGNAITHYLHSLGENSLDGPLDLAYKTYGDEFYKWGGDSIPIKELPLEKVKTASAMFDSYINNHIRRATQCRDCEWGLAEESLTGKETIEFLLPSVQHTRSISRVLALRARLAIAEGRYEDAIDHLRMNFVLARNVSQLSFLVADLVAISEIGIGFDPLVDLIGATDSPNLYWALAELPVPMIDLRESIQLEMSLTSRLIPALDSPETARHSDDEWNRIYAETIGTLLEVSVLVSHPNEPSPEAVPMWPMLVGMASYSSAKQRLQTSGFEIDEIESMAVGQVLLMDAAITSRQRAGDLEKSMYVPFDKTFEYSRIAEAGLNPDELSMDLGSTITAMLLPATQQVRSAQIRIEWQRNALMIVEAIRMHLAATGKLPTTLAEITVVPIPNNPYNGQPYEYRLDGQTAILDLPAETGPKVMAWRFEITVAK